MRSQRTRPFWLRRDSDAGLALGQMGPRAEPKKTLALEYLNVCPRSQTSYPMQVKWSALRTKMEIRV
jgi:hypothetical protein